MPTAVTEPPKKLVAIPGSNVKSTLAATPPFDPKSPFNLAKWAGAGVMSFPDPNHPQGYLMVMNDHQYLYLLIDLPHETTPTLGPHDAAYVAFDVDGNGAITPSRDVNYCAPWNCYGNSIAMQYYLGPGWWTFVLSTPTLSASRTSFAPSSHSATPHRIYEIRIDFKEIGIDFSSAVTFPILHFGVAVFSSVHPDLYFPTNCTHDFSHLPGIALAASVPLPATGLPVAGVGLVPLGCINNGHATTASTYYLPVTDAAFGGTMNLIADANALTVPYQKHFKYRVRLDGAGEPLRASWYNYHLLPLNNWVYEYFTSDTDGCYAVPDLTQTYSIGHLLFQWDTSSLKSGIHTLNLDILDQNTVVQSQAIQLFIDNNLPDTRIIDITYKGQIVAPCDIVTIDTHSTDPVKVDYVVYDTEGDVYDYGLYVYHGHNQLDVLLPQTVPVDHHGPGSVTCVAPAPPAFPPETCAYEFRLWAYANVTNGNCYLGYADDTVHVTFQVPQSGAAAALKKVMKRPMPNKMSLNDGRSCKMK